MSDFNQHQPTGYCRAVLLRLAVMTVCIVACAASWADGRPTATGRPNLVFILADDLGYGDLGCYNADSKIPTPHLDRLAGEGMRFTDAHSSAAACSPARYALLTGRHCWRSRLQAGVVFIWGRPLIKPGQMTLASLLRDRGYATACIGKWHLGWDWPTHDGRPPRTNPDLTTNVEFARPIENGPTSRGFERYFGVDVPNFPPYCYIENDRTVGIPSAPSRPEFNRPGPMLPGWQWDQIMPELTRRATDYISGQAGGDRPFFLYLPLTAPHYPVVPTEEFRGQSGVGEYGDFVMQVDATVGRVLAALDETGIADETLLFFSSDNGPEVTGEVDPGVYDRAERYGHFSNDGLRGAKRDLWEAGHRVPFLARWPGRIAAGSTSDALIDFTDLLATTADLLEVNLPPDAGVDSHSFLPVLTGEASESFRQALVHHSGSGKFAIRQGDWVLLEAPSGDDNRTSGETDWYRRARGYGPDDGQPQQLYNLREDPAQHTNLSAQHPEKTAALRELLVEYIAHGRSTPGPPQANDVDVVIRKSPR